MPGYRLIIIRVCQRHNVTFKLKSCSKLSICEYYASATPDRSFTLSCRLTANAPSGYFSLPSPSQSYDAIPYYWEAGGPL
jgi:hypothetical protein